MIMHTLMIARDFPIEPDIYSDDTCNLFRQHMTLAFHNCHKEMKKKAKAAKAAKPLEEEKLPQEEQVTEEEKLPQEVQVTEEEIDG